MPDTEDGSKAVRSEGSNQNAKELLQDIGKETDLSAYDFLEPEQDGYRCRLTLAEGENEIKIDAPIDQVGLDADSRKKVGKFSLGMRQRLGIAQAIMENPDLIILDEPMNGLDKHGIRLVKELLCQLKEQGKTILLSSHYAEDMEVCDEVYEMDEGCLSCCGLA
ncbi:MAG: ATP-binding cassette domain-containing protein [Clostridium sp.]|nr:ATP-binding cassette domain-containing protein [Clostridium sp.]